MPIDPHESKLPHPELVLDRMVEWRKQAEAHLAATDARITALEAERNHALKWGIIALGTAVIGMAAWIWNIVAGHIR